jgi:DNA repair exonuclease SbcCD ATPase subunit
MIGHGNWEAWLRENVAYSETTARTLMRAYREMGNEQVDMLTGEAPADVFECLNLSQMVALFPLPVHERAAFVKVHDVKEMSVREIEAIVAEATEKGKREASEAYEKAVADANGNVERLMNKLAAAQDDADNAEKVKAKAIERRDELIARLDEEKEKHEAEVRELEAKAKKLSEEIEMLRNAPVQESIVYVEKEVEQIDKPTEDGKAAKLEEELKAVQEKLAEAEQRAAAVEHKADMRVQAINFALREISDKLGVIGDAIDEIRGGTQGDGELADKLKASAAKAIKAMLEGARWMV